MQRELFFAPAFEHRILVFDEPNGKITDVKKATDLDLVRASTELEYYVRSDQLVTEEQLLGQIKTYKLGEQGDRDMTAENKAVGIRIIDHMSDRVPEIQICCGVIICMGKNEATARPSLSNDISYSSSRFFFDNQCCP